MGTYTGTNCDDTITPTTVSAGVTRVPDGTKPSDAADTVIGRDGSDVLDGGGGADIITFSGLDSLVRGGTGNDRIT